MRAASAEVGGCGFPGGCFGGSAFSIGLRDSHFQRTARRSAPLRMTWICRIVDCARGLQTCWRQRWSQSCGVFTRCSMTRRRLQCIRQRRNSA